ncbi:unnamed protein product, partial [Mesorhabditis spiculigera]
MNVSIEPGSASATLHFPTDALEDLLLASEEPYYPLSTRILITFLFVTLGLIGVVGNLMVIIVVYTVKGMVSTTNCYLVSLAIADAMFFIATLPSEMMLLHLEGQWHLFGSIGCSIFAFLPYFALTASVLSITAFTVERYLGICYPYKQLTWCSISRAKTIIRCIWLFSFIYNAPWLYLATVVEIDPGHPECTFKLDRDNWRYKAIYLFDFFTFYAIPMILNIVIYAKIAVQISRCGTMKMKMKHTIKGGVTSTGKAETTHTDFRVSTGSGRNPQKNRHGVVKMLAVVVITFAACWLPYKAMVMHNSFSDVDNKWDSETYIFFAKTMIFINCAINPILYNLMSNKFRSAFAQLLKGKKGKGSNSPKKGVSLLNVRPQERRRSDDDRWTLRHDEDDDDDDHTTESPKSSIKATEKCQLVQKSTTPLVVASPSVRFEPLTPSNSDGIIVEL